jgi:lipopolysaccharide transport system ATP-binding protein
LQVKRGERLGIIGRNGAGKTTLLKLITRNYRPSGGDVTINGKVQCLMDAGLGFHPEFTGLENIRSSLIFNGLNKEQQEDAMKDIIDFVELGDFLNQPIKTYSLGMATRLAFAAATAIKPDILIIDEVLSAGDAYFSKKASDRMRKVTSNGTTLLLVSHSTEQILQYCEKAIWLNQGKVLAQGPAIEVIKAYDAFIRELEEKHLEEQNLKRFIQNRSEDSTQDENIELKENSISRWSGDDTFKIENVKLLNSENKEALIIQPGDDFKLQIKYRAYRAGVHTLKLHAYLFSLDGRPLTLHLSEEMQIETEVDKTYTAELIFDKFYLGNGEYVFTVGLFKNLDIDKPEEAVRYDLLDRSFHFKVKSKSKNDVSLFYHQAYWLHENKQIISDFTTKAIE